MKRGTLASAVRLLGAVAVVAHGGIAGAVTPGTPIIYGTLGNFDVVNNTGQPCNGFEIELEDVRPGEVVYAFGDSGGPNPVKYNRYGRPQILPNASGTGTIVRYASPFDAGARRFSEATPVARSPTPVTMGHQCWVYGDPVNYPTSGCEHFGVSLVRTPTRTLYRWLVGDTATGTLKVAGTGANPGIPAPVQVPPPVWSVRQPPPPVPGDPPPPPQVFAAVDAPPAPPVPPGRAGAWGEAIWMKIYKTEVQEAAELDDLLLGGNDQRNNRRVVPDGEHELPEIEWQLLQSPPLDRPGAGVYGANEQGGEPGDGNEQVIRRYEFYKYTGPYDPDPENLNEALCDNPRHERCGPIDPVTGVRGVGDLLGSQNGAANLVPLCAADDTGAIAIKRGGFSFNFTTRLYSQLVTLTNKGQSTVFGPVSLALDSLSLTAPGDGLFNLSGRTACTVPQQSPYIDVIATPAGGIAPGASVSVVLKFSNASRAGITYTPRVLSTAGSR
jgi:hypothetical protein